MHDAVRRRRVSTSATITRRLPLQDGGFCGAAFFAPIDRQRYIAIGDAAREVRFPSVSPVFPRFGENAAKRLPRLPRDTGEEGGHACFCLNGPRYCDLDRSLGQELTLVARSSEIREQVD